MKVKKILYILNIAKRVNSFSHTCMLAAQQAGMEFHIAGNWSYASDEEREADEERYGIRIHQIDFIRAPYHPGNRKAYAQLKALVEKENYDVIHCNTPVGGVLGRMIGKRFKTEHMIYQAHGFHFYKGAPFKNWLLYYPVEKWLAHYTDTLITINEEDYALAKTKMKLRKGGCVHYVPGVGIDLGQFYVSEEARADKRREFGIGDGDIMLLSVGELNDNKNHRAVIEALARVQDRRVYYVICGRGPLADKHKALAEELGVGDRVILAGFRTDVKDIYSAADIYIFPSFREGLSVALMEAMACERAIICSKIRGNTDLIEDGVSGRTVVPNPKEIAEAIRGLLDEPETREAYGKAAKARLDKFEVGNVTQQYKRIYMELETEEKGK